MAEHGHERHGSEHGGGHGSGKEKGKDFMREGLYIIPRMLRQVFAPKEFLQGVGKIGMLLADFLGGPFRRGGGGGGGHKEAHSHGGGHH